MKRTSNPTRRHMLALGAAVAMTLGMPTALAQSKFPDRPIRLLVPFAPGGSSEIISRAFAAEMGKTLGQTVIVENKPGGAGNIAMQEAARANADGYTIILGHVGTLAVNPAMFAKLPYDPVKDFIPITMLASVPSLLVVNAEKVAAKNLKEFVDMVKSKPGAIDYGSAGNASSGHLAMAYLANVAGLDIQHVPYKGTGPMMTDLLAGRLSATFTGAPPLLQHVKAGKLRAIAIGTATRAAQLPDVPTVAEQGYAGFETSQWYGLLAPAGTPADALNKIRDAAIAAGKTAQVADRLSAEAAVISTGSTAEFTAYINKERLRWGEVVKKANIKVD